jgi:hypothetical protein
MEENNIINSESKTSQESLKITAENVRSLVKFLQRTNLSPSEIDEFLNLIKVIQVISSNMK